MYGSTDRNEEARGAIGATEGIWEQLEPSIVTVHDEVAVGFSLHLCEPSVLV